MTNVTYPQAKDLKELGFDKQVRDYFDYENKLCFKANTSNWNLSSYLTSAPTRSEVLEWAREKKGIDGWAQPRLNDYIDAKRYVYYIFQSKYYGQSAGTYPTHAEAETALINKIIEILKEQKG